MTGFDIGLLRKAVDWAEHEHARKRQVRKGVRYFLKRGEHTWQQSFWGVAKVTKRALEERTPTYSSAHGSTLWAIDPMSCGTTGCIAGHMCVIAGDQYLIPAGIASGQEIQVDFVLTQDGRVCDINNRAMELMGASTETDLGDLFSGGNSIYKVRAIAEQIARDHGEEL